MTKAYGYARVSTSSQEKEETITIQLEAIRRHAESCGYTLEGIYTDEAISGASELEGRPGLSNLIFDLEESEGAVVIIYKLDRLARDLYIQEHLYRKILNCKATLVSIKEPDICSNDPMRKAFRQFMGIVAELERAFIRMRMTDGKRKRARSGGWNGGILPYGYQRSSHPCGLEINAHEASVVKMIFDMAQTRTANGISRALNESPVTMRRGNKWTAWSVMRTIRSKMLRGYITYSSGISVYVPELVIVPPEHSDASEAVKGIYRNSICSQYYAAAIANVQ